MIFCLYQFCECKKNKSNTYICGHTLMKGNKKIKRKGITKNRYLYRYVIKIMTDSDFKFMSIGVTLFGHFI